MEMYNSARKWAAELFVAANVKNRIDKMSNSIRFIRLGKNIFFEFSIVETEKYFNCSADVN